MKENISIAIILLFCCASVHSQVPEISLSTIKKDMYFLASDELEGRKTGEQGSLIAARYMAESFRQAGLQSLEGTDDYYQNITFEKRKPSKSATITLKTGSLTQGKEILMLNGNKNQLTAPIVFVDQGWINDTLDNYDGINVEGKIVLALFGVPGSTDPRDGFSGIRNKMRWASEKGAIGMIEIYSGAFPWGMLTNFLNREQTSIALADGAPDDFQYALSDFKFTEEISLLKDEQTVEVVIENEGVVVKKTSSPNVVGWLEGTDEKLKDEYVIISAHYDHVGTKDGGEEEDNIFNGARDNAIGLTAIISAANYFNKNRPKRSLLFLAFTAEEIGLLGSNYYVENPVKPLNKAIFNLNTDGAGYNDTTLVTVIGHDRVGVWDILQSSGAAVGLTTTGDPAPEQGLFDRSDNVSFAKHGIPAPTYSPGVSAFDQELMKYYHQTSDNPDQINYNYLKKFIQSYIIASQKIANIEYKPKWKAGDKYEAAYNKLYGM